MHSFDYCCYLYDTAQGKEKSTKIMEAGQDMRKSVFRKKGIRALMAVCILALLLLESVSALASERDDSAGGAGSLSLTLEVTEQGKTVPLTEVPFALYQVGEMNTETGSFQLKPSLSIKEVNLNALKTAADAENAARELTNAVGTAGIDSRTGITDMEGNYPLLLCKMVFIC